MSVTVTVRLVAQDPQQTLHVLEQALPVTRQYPGNRSSRTFVNTEKPHEIVLIQEWDSVEHQRRYIAWRQQSGDLARLLATLTEPPTTDYLEFNPA